MSDHYQRMLAMLYNACEWAYKMDRHHLWVEPSSVRWTESAAASIAEDEDHLRGLVKRHCL